MSKEGRRQRAEGRRKEKKKGIEGEREYSVGLRPTLIQDRQPVSMAGAWTPVGSGQREQRVLLITLITSSALCPLPSAFCPLPSSGHSSDPLKHEIKIIEPGDAVYIPPLAVSRWAGKFITM